MKKPLTGKPLAKKPAARIKLHEDDAPALTKALLKKAVLMPPITDPNWKLAMGKLQAGGKKKKVALALEPEVYRWFQAQGKDAPKRVNALLKDYIQLLERHAH